MTKERSRPDTESRSPVHEHVLNMAGIDRVSRTLPITLAVAACAPLLVA